MTIVKVEMTTSFNDRWSANLPLVPCPAYDPAACPSRCHLRPGPEQIGAALAADMGPRVKMCRDCSAGSDCGDRSKALIEWTRLGKVLEAAAEEIPFDPRGRFRHFVTIPFCRPMRGKLVIEGVDDSQSPVLPCTAEPATCVQP
jgi:hypothetical protein